MELRQQGARAQRHRAAVDGVPAELLQPLHDRTVRRGALRRRRRTSDDFTYSDLGIASFTWELDGSGAGCAGEFLPLYSCMDAYEANNLPGLYYDAAAARTPYQLSLGPTATSVTTSGAGASVTVTTAAKRLGVRRQRRRQAGRPERHGCAHLRRDGAVGRRYGAAHDHPRQRHLRSPRRRPSTRAPRRPSPTCRRRTRRATGVRPSRSGSPRPDTRRHARPPQLDKPTHHERESAHGLGSNSTSLASTPCGLGCCHGRTCDGVDPPGRRRHVGFLAGARPDDVRHLGAGGEPNRSPGGAVDVARLTTCWSPGRAPCSTCSGSTATRTRLAAVSGVQVVGSVRAAPVGPMPAGTRQPGQHPAAAAGRQEVRDLLRRLPHGEGVRPVRERPADEVPRAGQEDRVRQDLHRRPPPERGLRDRWTRRSGCKLTPNVDKPRFLLETQIHAREIATSEMSWRLLTDARRRVRQGRPDHRPAPKQRDLGRAAGQPRRRPHHGGGSREGRHRLRLAGLAAQERRPEADARGWLSAAVGRQPARCRPEPELVRGVGWRKHQQGPVLGGLPGQGEDVGAGDPCARET